MSSGRPSRRTFVRTIGMGAAAMFSRGQSTAQQPPARAPVPADEYEAIAAVVRKHTGQEATSVEELTWFDVYGDANGRYHSVRCEEREYIVRAPSRPPELGAEPRAVVGRYVLDRLRERGLAAPLVYAVDRDCDIVDHPVAVMTRIAGRPWRHYEDLWERDPQIPMPATGAQVGRYVRGLHDIPVEQGFGSLDEEGLAPLGSWAETRWSQDTTWAELALARGTISDDEFALVAPVIDTWAAECDLPEGRALWMDDIMFGLMVDARKQTVTGICQAAAAASGDPDYELEWFAYYAEDTRSLIVPPDEFAEGYGRPYDEKSNRRSFYRMSCYLCKLSWLPPDSDRAADHRQKLIAIARKLA